MARPSVSVKLSAIHPRFDPGKEARLDAELLPRIVELAAAARRHGLGLTIDAEEQDRLDLTLGLFAAAFRDPALEGWPGLGLAVQAYGKRALPVLDGWRSLPTPGQAHPRAPRQRRLLGQRDQVGAGARPCRLSGLHAQGAHGRVVSGVHAVHAGAPGGVLSAVRHPQRPDHRLRACGGGRSALRVPTPARHGRGALRGGGGRGQAGRPCRIYAPVGPHEDLVAYLVRRLLENGANTSFVNRLADEAAPIEDIVRDPLEIVAAERAKRDQAAAAATRHLSARSAATVPGSR